MSGNVYVVQQRFARNDDGSRQFHDYGTAFKYGPVIYLVPPKSTVDEMYDGDLDRLLSERLSNFKEDDFLILTGDPVVCAQAILHAVAVLEDHVKVLRILKWSHEQGEYNPVEIHIPY